MLTSNETFPLLFSAGTKNLKYWQVSGKTVSLFIGSNPNSIKMTVHENDGKTTPINLRDVDGLPKTMLTDRNELQAFLRDTYVTLSCLNTGEYRAYIKHRIRGGGNTINPHTEQKRLWPDGIISFYINTNDFSKGSMEFNSIMGAINIWRGANTGFQFISCDNKNSDCIAFDQHSFQCFSHVGRNPGGQNIKCALKPGGGFDTWSIVHEIGHAIGLHHEQSREDRGDFVSVCTRDSNYKIDGKKHGLYDFDSVMHYPLKKGVLERKDKSYSSELVVQPTSEVGQRDHLSEGDVAAAKYLCLYAKAIGGNMDAQFEMGLYHDSEFSEKVRANNRMAVYFYNLAANQGHSDAQYNLAVCYENGQGIKLNLKQAKHFYKKAADQGDKDAQASLEKLQPEEKGSKNKH